jgi:hypothetical protein
VNKEESKGFSSDKAHRCVMNSRIFRNEIARVEGSMNNKGVQVEKKVVEYFVKDIPAIYRGSILSKRQTLMSGAETLFNVETDIE